MPLENFDLARISRPDIKIPWSAIDDAEFDVHVYTAETVCHIICHYPQTNRQGELLWLIRHGMVVEFLRIGMGLKAPEYPSRVHHDLDVTVFTDPKKIDQNFTKHFDAEHPGFRQSDVSLDFIRDTAYRFKITPTIFGDIPVVLMHPALVAWHKLTDSRTLREKDELDLRILRLAKEKMAQSGEWEYIFSTILSGFSDAGRQWLKQKGFDRYCLNLLRMRTDL